MSARRYARVLSHEFFVNIDVLQAYLQCSVPALHRVHGVVAQVDDYLVDLRGVSYHHGIAVKRRPDLNVVPVLKPG